MTNEEKMTPEEAIAEISFLKVAVNKVMEQALDMAIKALSQEPKSGKWIIDLQTATEDYYICSECGRKIHLLYPDIISNYPYCHCGARMESEVEE